MSAARTSRRALLGGGAGLVAAAAAPSVPPPDPFWSDLHNSAAALIERQRAVRKAFFAESSPVEMETLGDQGIVLAEQIDAMIGVALERQATCLTGLVAKARLLRHQITVFHSDRDVLYDDLDDEIALAVSLCDDLIASAPSIMCGPAAIGGAA